MPASGPDRCASGWWRSGLYLEGRALSEPGALCRRVAAAADLCLKPHLHAVVAGDGFGEEQLDCTLRIQPRSSDGTRLPLDDIELEIYRSGEDLHLMLSWPAQPQQPMLWQGNHPVWMDGESGLRCERPDCGAPLEALARRLRALLGPSLQPS
ncbi:hypothetical protein FB106_102287 [Synechococcus sp. Ace-Pa]|nr:hypothetical protein FB106_102287 [Synechococcus sp. Ace-Pa]